MISRGGGILEYSIAGAYLAGETSESDADGTQMLVAVFAAEPSAVIFLRVALYDTASWAVVMRRMLSAAAHKDCTACSCTGHILATPVFLRDWRGSVSALIPVI